MMSRIIQPKCVCGQVAQYDSTRWPTVRLCFQCIRLVRNWCIKNNLADKNPWFFELACLGNTDEREMKMHDGTTRLSIWADSPDGTASRMYWIETLESEVYFPDPIDFDDEVC